MIDNDKKRNSKTGKNNTAHKKKNSKINKKKAQINKVISIIATVAILGVLFVGVYFLTTFIYDTTTENKEETTVALQSSEADTSDTVTAETTTAETVKETDTTVVVTTNVPETTTRYVSSGIPNATVIDFPSDDASWKMICLNRKRCVDASAEDNISLSYVAGSSEMMDSRAAAAYNQMYDAAAEDGIYLTPCSGYRSYSTQKRLYYEFVNDYLRSGYSESEAHELTSRRRNPPGSSEHNIGICMDIICASSSANFQNTKAYAWLTENAQDYGFILRYPEDKVNVTGVKFEPWHWRYVGVENASAIKNSGLCLEEYLGLV